MRNGFIDELMKIAEQDQSVILLTPDMGFSVFERFQERFPERYYNVGISEQAMVGIASGLAMDGYKPFCYSLVPFILYRAFEQVRIDICSTNLNVKMIGGACGWSYESQGTTHHAIEDLALTRSLPNMTVFSPCDYYSARALTKKAYLINGPVYIRIGKNSEDRVYDLYDYTSDDFNILTRGENLLLVATGRMTRRALALRNQLGNADISSTIVDILTVKKFNTVAFMELLESHDKIATIEEHTVIGGIGSLVAELMSGILSKKKLLRLGLDDTFCNHCGDTDSIDRFYGLDTDSIAERIITLVK
jgi:transketolase